MNRQQLPAGVSLPNHPPATFLPDDAPLTGLAREYLEALLHGERRQATQMILQSADAGTPIKDLYLNVFQPVQREIGRLWQLNRITVGQEHYCTAATQLVISRLYPRIFAGEKNGSTLVMSCVAGELHELGARMVADFFEMEGWETVFLGADTPIDGVLSAVQESAADVLGVSVTIPTNLDAARALIRSVREMDPPAPARIMIGGNAVNTVPELWRQMAADATASDAQCAVENANRLVGRRVDET